MIKSLSLCLLSIIFLVTIQNKCFAQHFETIWSGNPYQPMSLIIKDAIIDGMEMEIGDEIAIFDIGEEGVGICVGTITLSEAVSIGSPAIFPAGSDDPLSTDIDGFTAGNGIIFKLWDNSESKEILINIPIYDMSYDVIYTNSGTAVLNSLIGYSSINTSAANSISCQGDFIIPINIENFINVSTLLLILNYDSTNLSYSGFQSANNLLNNGTFSVDENNGDIYISWNSTTAVSIFSGQMVELLFTASTVYSQIEEPLTWDELDSFYKDSIGMVYNTEFSNGLITIDPIPVGAGTISGLVDVCQGTNNENYIIDSITNASSYTWEIDPQDAGTIFGSGTDITIEFSASYSGQATLSVYGSNSCGDGIPSTLTINVISYPTVSACENAIICEDNTMTLDATATNQQSVLWETSGDGEFDDVALLSATYTPGTNDISNGTVDLTITANAITPCGTNAIDEMTLTIQSLPMVFAGDDAYICMDNAMTLEATATDQYSVLWETSGDGEFDDETLLKATYTPGTYDISNGTVNLTITANAIIPCGTNVTDGMILSIDSFPGQPVIPEGPINVDLNYTQISEYKTQQTVNTTEYFWFIEPIDAGNISGSDTIGTVIWNSDYTGLTASVHVKSYNENCGKVSSDTLEIGVQLVGINQYQTSDIEINISPNPTNGEFVISIIGTTEDMDLIIINSVGQFVLQKKLMNTVNTNEYLINIKPQISGIYYLKLFKNDIILMKKLLII